MKKFAIPLVIVLIALCAFGGYAFKKMGSAKDAATQGKKDGLAVTRGDLLVMVVETGTVDAIKSVEVKSRVTGRLAKLLVDEGDFVTQNQRIALIDPQETELQVQQDSAQLDGARSSVQRTDIEIAQRRISARAALQQAVAREAQLRAEMKAQPTLTTAAIEQAKSQLSSAKKTKENLINSDQPNARTTADSTVRQAQANYDNANREYNRRQELLTKGYVAQRDVETAKLDLDLAKVRLDSAKDSLSRLDAQFAADRVKADESIRQAQLQLQTAQANSIQNETKRQDYLSAIAEVDKARAALRDVDALIAQRNQSQATVRQLSSVLSNSNRQLHETEIKSPIPGVVTKKLLQEGELATGLSGFSSGTPILRIEDRRAMIVQLDINEIDVAKMKTGMVANITVDALPSENFKGVVTKIAPSSKALGSGTQTSSSADSVVLYEVEIRIDNPGAKLRSGMSAKCSLEVARRDKTLVLPIEYVQKVGQERFVYFPAKNPKDPKSQPEKRAVKTGLETGSQIEILSGVSEGDQVIKPVYGGPPRKGMMQMGGDE